MKYYSTVLLLVILLVIGCSHQNNPTSPQVRDTLTEDQNSLKITSNNNRHILGMWDIRIDESRENIAINRSRNSDMHQNSLGFLEPPFCNDCVVPGNIQIISETEFSIDVRLRHPQPDRIENTVFDVRGILMLGQNFVFPENGRSIAFGPGFPKLINADGYTTFADPINQDEPASNLHPFKAFNPDAHRRIFSVTDEDTRTFHMKAPAGQIEFVFAIDCCWTLDANSNNPSSDFPEDANCSEAYRTNIDLEFWPNQGESSPIRIQVFDHQGEDTIDEVSLESPGLFDDVIVLQRDHSCGCSIPTFAGLLPNDRGGLDGQSPILIRVTDTSTDENPGDVSAYHVIRSFADAKYKDVANGVSATSQKTSAINNRLLAKYQSNPGEFEETRIGDLIVRWKQQTVSNDEHTAVVQNAQEVLQFDHETGELVKHINTWRHDLPGILPDVISQEEAESIVAGEIQFSDLYYMSLDSDVFPIEFTSNPVYVVQNGIDTAKILDATTGEYLGDAVPPPADAFSLTGPQAGNGTYCSGAWTSWYLSGQAGFEALGYDTDAEVWPTHTTVQSYVQDDDVKLFYELAHGSSYYYLPSCTNGYHTPPVSASQVGSWLTEYNKKDFTFLGSCGGMCSTGPGSLSHAYRKGSDVDTATVGYCDMAGSICSTYCWYAGYTVVWQNAVFDYMEDNYGWSKYSIYDAFLLANADYPGCGSAENNCMRFAGDTDFTLDVNYDLGHLCETCDDCASTYCEGSLNHPARCGINPPTEDGWIGGGDNSGCGTDPSSEYRDYYYDSYGQEQYEVIETFNCDEYDDCEGPEVTDYFVIENTNTCDYNTWLDTDPNVPVLISPSDGYEYKVGDNLTFEWEPGEGSNSTYYFSAKHNGNPYVTDLIFIGTELWLPAIFVENEADDGEWEWWVSNGPDNYQSSEHFTLLKNTKPELLGPSDYVTITPETSFSWTNVPNAENYVVKVSGPGFNFPPYYAFYIAIGDSTYFMMDQFIYDFLMPGTYTWRIAAVSNPYPGIDEMVKYEYSDPLHFSKPG